MEQAFNQDINHFLKNKLAVLMEGIDVQYEDMVPKKSEYYVQRILKDTRGKLVVNEAVHNIMHRYIRYAKSKGFDRYLILGAFGHGKTEQICTGYLLYRIAENPNILIKIVHVSETEAVKRCRALRDYIQKDEDFKRECPHIIPTPIWGSQRFIVKRSAMLKDGTVEAYGVMSTAIGGRANLIVFDDPQDLKTAVLEPTTRVKIEDVFKNIWLTRLIPQDSEVIVMMNKWHENDLAAVIQNNPIWSWMSIAVNEDTTGLIYEDSFGRKMDFPLWTKFNEKDLYIKQQELGTRDYDRGYRLVPYTDSDKTFPNFLKCCHYGLKPTSVIDDEKNWVFIGGIDFAGLRRPGTVLVVLAVHKKTGMKVPVEIDMLRGTGDLIPLMIKHFRRYGCDFYKAENNGVQEAIIDMLISSLGDEKIRRYGIRVEPFLTGRNKADPITGLPSIDKEFENQEWMFCFPDKPGVGNIDERNPWHKSFQEFKHHPFFETTDIVMASWFAREGAKELFRGSLGPNIY
jgi:hypothetical protein